MKWIVSTIALSLSSLVLAQDVTVIQINAKWNRDNTLSELRELDNCEYVFGCISNCCTRYFFRLLIFNLPDVRSIGFFNAGNVPS